MSIAARYRSNYLGSVSLPTQTQAASYSVSSSDEPTRGGSTPDAVPGQALDPNRVPPEGSLDRKGSGKVSKVRVHGSLFRLSSLRHPPRTTFCTITCEAVQLGALQSSTTIMMFLKDWWMMGCSRQVRFRSLLGEAKC